LTQAGTLAEGVRRSGTQGAPHSREPSAPIVTSPRASRMPAPVNHHPDAIGERERQV
jgi:hypothetical protein